MKCKIIPQHPELIKLINKYGQKNGTIKFLRKEFIEDKEVNYQLKVFKALNNPNVRNYDYSKNKGEGFYNDLIKQGVPKDQVDLVRQYIVANDISSINKNDLLTSLLTNYSYTVEINTAKTKGSNILEEGRFDVREFLEAGGTMEDLESQTPTQHYSNLTVPGGTNYTENEIATPAIAPSIKGHAQFSSDQGIGWFRSDEKRIDDNTGKRVPDGAGGLVQLGVVTDSKTRRILEVQSDWGQKQRKSSEPDINVKYNIQQIINDLQKSGDLKIDCN